MDLTDKIIAYESGELLAIEIVKLFAELIKTKMAWSLQGCYSRTAAAFIRAGVISSDTGMINYERLDELQES